MTKNDQKDPTSIFLRGIPMIWTKTDEAIASSASVVATAMVSDIFLGLLVEISVYESWILPTAPLNPVAFLHVFYIK